MRQDWKCSLLQGGIGAVLNLTIAENRPSEHKASEDFYSFIPKDITLRLRVIEYKHFFGITKVIGMMGDVSAKCVFD